MKISKEVRIGLIMIGGLAVMLFGLNYLKGSSLISTRRSFYAIYPKVDGLKETNPININGFKVGSVSKIELMPDNSGRLKITLAFTDKNLKITRGSIARIVSADILGSKAVEFVPGLGSEELEQGSEITAEIQQSLTEVISENIDPVKAKFVKLMGSVDSVLSGIQGVLNDQTVGDINMSFGDIRSTLQSLRHATATLDDILTSQSGNLTRTMDNMANISNTLSNSSKSIGNIVANMDTITTGIREADIAATLNKAKSAIEQTNEIVAKINRGEGSMGMLVNSDSLHKQIVETTKELENLFEDIQAHPKRYVNFSVLGRKEKGLTLTKDEETRLKEMLNNGKR